MSNEKGNAEMAAALARGEYVIRFNIDQGGKFKAFKSAAHVALELARFIRSIDGFVIGKWVAHDDGRKGGIQGLYIGGRFAGCIEGPCDWLPMAAAVAAVIAIAREDARTAAPAPISGRRW